MIQFFVPRGARRMRPSGAPGDEEGSLGRSFPAMIRRGHTIADAPLGH